MVFDVGIRVGGVGVNVPVHFVGETEPDDGCLGVLFGEKLVHGGCDGRGGDLGEGDERLEGDGVDGAVEGGGEGLGVHFGVWSAHTGCGGNVGVVAVGAGTMGW